MAQLMAHFKLTQLTPQVNLRVRLETSRLWRVARQIRLPKYQHDTLPAGSEVIFGNMMQYWHAE
jgi:hypothetical protein